MLRVGSVELEVEAAAPRVKGQLQAQPHDSYTLLQTLHTHPLPLPTPSTYALSCKRQRTWGCLPDGWTDGLAGRQAGRQTHRRRDRQTDIQIDEGRAVQAGRQTSR